jgi:hypothetical protein
MATCSAGHQRMIGAVAAPRALEQFGIAHLAARPTP